MPPKSAPYDVVVVGLGLAGLVAALAAAGSGARTLAVARGYGTLRFRAGTLDVLGYRDGRVVESPRREVAAAASSPGHPYALAGDGLEPGVEAVRSAAAAAGLALEGSLDGNRLVATAAGSLRPTCLAPASMTADWRGARVLVAGLTGYRDFEAHLVAAVLPAAAARHGVELSARALTVGLPSLRRRHLGGMELARLFDEPGFRRELIAAVRGGLDRASLVALPAVLGLEDAAEAAADLSRGLGVPVVELPTLPPSVPGIRLEMALTSALRRCGGTMQVGPAARTLPGEGRVAGVELDAAGHPLRVPAGAVVLASGGLASGGLEVSLDGAVRETVAGLPVSAPAPGEALFGSAFLEPGGHPAGAAGVRVDASMRPVGPDGEPIHPNLFAAGGLLAGADRAVERSADGICCATGWRAGIGAAA